VRGQTRLEFSRVFHDPHPELELWELNQQRGIPLTHSPPPALGSRQRSDGEPIPGSVDASDLSTHTASLTQSERHVCRCGLFLIQPDSCAKGIPSNIVIAKSFGHGGPSEIINEVHSVAPPSGSLGWPHSRILYLAHASVSTGLGWAGPSPGGNLSGQALEIWRSRDDRTAQ